MKSMMPFIITLCLISAGTGYSLYKLCMALIRAYEEARTNTACRQFTFIVRHADGSTARDTISCTSCKAIGSADNKH